MVNGKYSKLFASTLVLVLISGCWLGMENVVIEGINFNPQKWLGSDVSVEDSVLCSGPEENSALTEISSFGSPSMITDVYYCAYFETTSPEYVAIDWYFGDEKSPFATSPLQLINENGLFYFSLEDSIDYSDHTQYDGEFNLDNQFSEGSFKIYVYNRRIVIREDFFHLQMNP